MKWFAAVIACGMLAAGTFTVAAFGLEMAAAQAEPTSPAVREAKQKYEAAVREAEAAVAAAKAAYLEQLDAALKAALKAEDLEEANRIDALRKALRAAPVTAGGPGDAAPAAAAGGKKPGWIVGSLKDSSGKPIKGLQSVTVNAHGTTLQGGQKASFVLEVDENGRFEQELPDGLYAVTATIVKEFEGSRYRLQLHPDDNKHEQTKTASKPGIVKHFTWKMTGLKPEYDPKQTFSYYGQHVRLYDAHYLGEDEEKLAAEFGNDATAVVTLTPTTTLIDGSKGAPIEIRATLGEIGTTLGHVKTDLPIATYRVEAKLNGRPLRVKLKYGDEPAAAVEAKFTQASEYDSIQPIQVYLSK